MRQCRSLSGGPLGREKSTGQRSKKSERGKMRPVVSLSSFEFYLLAGVNIQLRQTKLRSVPAALRSAPVGSGRVAVVKRDTDVVCSIIYRNARAILLDAAAASSSTRVQYGREYGGMH